MERRAVQREGQQSSAVGVNAVAADDGVKARNLPCWNSSYGNDLVGVRVATGNVSRAVGLEGANQRLLILLDISPAEQEGEVARDGPGGRIWRRGIDDSGAARAGAGRVVVFDHTDRSESARRN